MGGGSLTEKTQIGDGSDHLEGIQVAAYAEGRLKGEALVAVETHLADCHECRAEASHVALFLAGRSTRRRWLIAVPAVAAAAAAIFLIMPLGEAGPGGPRLRPGAEAGREDLPAIEVLAPTVGPTSGADSVRFVWRSAGSDVMYRLMLTDESGSILWESETADTALVLPTDVRLEGGHRYLWYVDAALTDGGVATTGVRELRIER